MKIRHKHGLLLFAAMVCALPGYAGETATLKNGFSIHYLRRETLADTTRLYVSESADSFVDVPTNEIIQIEQDTQTPAMAPKTPPRSGPHAKVDLDQALSAASFRNNLNPDLVRSVVRAESGFNPNALSGKGAQGLMQLMPQTASKLGVNDPFDPVENLEGGTRYLRELLGRYNNNLPIALAAYNAGPQRVEQFRGIPPYPETIAYVNRILRDLYQPPSASRAFSSQAATQQPKKTASNRPHLVTATKHLWRPESAETPFGQRAADTVEGN